MPPPSKGKVEALVSFKMEKANLDKLRKAFAKALTLSKSDVKKVLESLEDGLVGIASSYQKAMKAEIDTIAKYMERKLGFRPSAGGGGGLSISGGLGGVGGLGGGVGGRGGGGGVGGGVSRRPTPLREAKGFGDRRTLRERLNDWRQTQRGRRMDRKGYMHGSGKMYEEYSNVKTDADWQAWKDKYKGMPGSGANPRGMLPGELTSMQQSVGQFHAMRGSALRSAGSLAALGGAPNLSAGFGVAAGRMSSIYSTLRKSGQGRRRSGGAAMLGGGASGLTSMIMGYVKGAVSLAERTDEARIRAMDVGASYMPLTPNIGGYSYSYMKKMPASGSRALGNYIPAHMAKKRGYKGLGFEVTEQAALGMQMAGAVGTTNKENMRAVLLSQRLGGNAGAFTGMLGAMAQTGAPVNRTTKILGKVIGTAIDQGLKKGRWRELFMGFKQLAKSTALGVRFNLSSTSAMSSMLVGITGGKKKSSIRGIRSVETLGILDAMSKGQGGGINFAMSMLASGMNKVGYFGAYRKMQRGITGGKAGVDHYFRLMEQWKAAFGVKEGGKIPDELIHMFSRSSGGEPGKERISMDLAEQILNAPKSQQKAMIAKAFKGGKSPKELTDLAVGKGTGMMKAGAWRRATLANQRVQLQVARKLRPSIVKLRTTLANLASTSLGPNGAITKMIKLGLGALTAVAKVANAAMPFINSPLTYMRILMAELRVMLAGTYLGRKLVGSRAAASANLRVVQNRARRKGVNP